MRVVLAMVLAAAAGTAAAAQSYVADGGGVAVAYFPNVGHAIPIVAFESGSPRAEPRIFDSGPQAAEALFAGSVQMAYMGPGPALTAFANSGGSVVVLSGAAAGGASMVARPGAYQDAELAGACPGPGCSALLDGKKIAAPQIGNTQDVSLRHLVEKHGLRTAERGGSVTVHNVANPDIYTLFAKGEIDAAWVPEPWATLLVRDLGGARLFEESETWPGGRFASVLLVADSDFARDSPEEVARWLESHARAEESIREDPRRAALLVDRFLEKTFGRGMGDTTGEALSRVQITSDPLKSSVLEFAERSAALGYLGRGQVDLGGLFWEGPA